MAGGGKTSPIAKTAIPPPVMLDLVGYPRASRR